MVKQAGKLANQKSSFSNSFKIQYSATCKCFLVYWMLSGVKLVIFIVYAISMMVFDVAV